MDLIQDVGAYAGFAAVIGLAVLSALFFSQARDLRRLREWAGRAPERAAEGVPIPGQTAVPEEAAQQATRPAPTGAVRPIPAAKPAPASAAGAAPATAVQSPPAPAKPGGPLSADGAPGDAKPAEGAPGDAEPAEAKPGDAQPPVAKPGAPQAPPVPAAGTAQTKAPPGGAPAGPKPATPAATPPAPQGTPPPAGTPTTPPLPPPVKPPLPPKPVAPVRPGGPARPTPALQQTAVLPASQRLRDSSPAASRRTGLSGRYIALIVAGVIVLGGAAAFGISQLGSGGDESGSESRNPPATPQDPGSINESAVTVSVLNGTTVPGLAAQIGDEVEAQGFQRGNVANALDQQRTESVVLFSEGRDAEAQLVARKLRISAVEPVDPDSQALAGNASVVVIVGSDRTQ